jgi:UDP-N-acetylglucosamine 2-epimerase (non-hydrolysing)
MIRKQLRVMAVIGARPNYMKAAPLVMALERLSAVEPGWPRVNVRVVHTGQHYEDALSRFLLDELSFPKVDEFLNVGSGTHAVQTAEILQRFEPVLDGWRPDVLVVFGDVNSTLACALVAAKSHQRLPDGRWTRPRIVHVEAGLRSFDDSMPEEINRRLTDLLADDLLTHSPEARDNLLREGVHESAIHYVGNLMIDTLDRLIDRARQSGVAERLGLIDGRTQAVRPYALLTLHRPSNVDDPATFERLLRAVARVSADLEVIYPIHPRVRGRVEEAVARIGRGVSEPVSRVVAIEPLTYLDFVGLMDRARLVFTDSGGVQEESTVLGVPCLTLRENTERPVTVTMGTNELAGTDEERIVAVGRRRLARGRTSGSRPPLWDGQAGERAARCIVERALGAPECA